MEDKGVHVAGSVTDDLAQWFSPEELREQQLDDQHAWRAIATILMSIVAFGLLLGLLATVLAVSFG